MTILLAAVAGLPAGWIGAHAIEAWVDRLPIREGPSPSARVVALTAVATMGTFGLVAWQQDDGWVLVGMLALTWGLIVGTVIDLRRKILPNRLTFRLPFLVGVPLVIAAIQTEAWSDLRRAALAAVLLPLGMLAFSELFRLVRGQTGMGLGDVKLAISLGLGLGWLGGFELIVFAYASIGVAVLVALALVAARRARLASRIPFGPYLAVGTLVVLIAGDPVVDWVRQRLIG